MAESSSPHDRPFPALVKTAHGTIGGIDATVQITYLADKVMITVGQGGRLSQWIKVPLSAPSAASVDASLPASALGSGETGLLPWVNLTPQTVVGAGCEERQTFGHLVAAQLATMILSVDDQDKRTLLVGLGLDPAVNVGQNRSEDNDSQRAYMDIMELAQSVFAG